MCGVFLGPEKLHFVNTSPHPHTHIKFFGNNKIALDRTVLLHKWEHNLRKWVVLEFLVKRQFKWSLWNEVYPFLFPSMGGKLSFLSCIFALSRKSHFWRPGEKGATSMVGHMPMQAATRTPILALELREWHSVFTPFLRCSLPALQTSERARLHLQSLVP